MISHLFKMIINKKKKNFFLLLQLFIAFVAMFFFIGLNLKKFSNYFKPMGYSYEKAWVIDIDFQNVTEEQEAELSQLVYQKLKGIAEVKAVSATNVVPFYQWGSEQKIEYNKQVSNALAFEVDENFEDVLDIKLTEGRWFSQKDYATNSKPVIITKDLAERDFPSENPLGKSISINDKPAVIIGISETFKENTSADVKPGFFIPMEKAGSKFIINSDQADNFQLLDDKLRKSVSSVGTNQIVIKQVNSLTLLKKNAHKLDYIQLSISLIVFAFLVLNVFLGVSGVFSYNLSKRKSEVGLRVAVGASSSDITKLFIGETIVLTTLGILPGILIAIQLLIMQHFDVYYGTLSIVLSALFLYLLMIACALYPSLKVAKVQPANALHED